MDSPSGRVPERAPDWFLVAREACDGRTPDLGFFLEVSGFIGPDGGGVASSGPLRGPQAWLVRPGGAPTGLVASSGPLSGIFFFRCF